MAKNSDETRVHAIYNFRTFLQICLCTYACLALGLVIGTAQHNIWTLIPWLGGVLKT